jgi:hypothetical protein
VCIRWISARSLAEQLRVGFLWGVPIAVFEFSIGASLGYSLERMLSDHTLTIMGLGLLFMLCAPALSAKAYGLGKHSANSYKKKDLS